MLAKSPGVTSSTISSKPTKARLPLSWSRSFPREPACSSSAWPPGWDSRILCWTGRQLGDLQKRKGMKTVEGALPLTVSQILEQDVIVIKNTIPKVKNSLSILSFQPVNISSFSLLTSLAPITASVGVVCLGPIFYLYYAWIPSCLPKDLFILSYRLYFCPITKFYIYIYIYIHTYIHIYIFKIYLAVLDLSCSIWDL